MSGWIILPVRSCGTGAAARNTCEQDRLGVVWAPTNLLLRTRLTELALDLKSTFVSGRPQIKGRRDRRIINVVDLECKLMLENMSE